MIKVLFNVCLVILLTILTQVGGIIYLLACFFAGLIKFEWRFKTLALFVGIYLLMTYIVVPPLAKLGGRERVSHAENISPTNYLTVLLNRNYVRSPLNDALEETAKQLAGTGIQLRYLDANFPFFNRFPLLPHLSHHDGKKIDLSFVYETPAGELTTRQRSISGYGVFANPQVGEPDQTQQCLSAGYWQYDFTKYATFGSINQELQFSEKGTKQLISALLEQDSIHKIFIEPHLKTRLSITSNRVRYHGCQAVRHDDHLHVQL